MLLQLPHMHMPPPLLPTPTYAPCRPYHVLRSGQILAVYSDAQTQVGGRCGVHTRRLHCRVADTLLVVCQSLPL